MGGCAAEWRLPGLGYTSVLRQAASFNGMPLFWWRQHLGICRNIWADRGKWCRGLRPFCADTSTRRQYHRHVARKAPSCRRAPHLG
jgi:hypothetical protein